jgi:hypothetical protein
VVLDPEKGTTTQVETYQDTLKVATSLYLDDFATKIHIHQASGNRNTKLAPPTARLWQVTLPP